MSTPSTTPSLQSYPSHKTFSFVEDAAVVQKNTTTEKQVQENVLPASNNYPTHKTVSFNDTNSSATTVVASNTPNVNVSVVNEELITAGYLPHKTVELTATDTNETKVNTETSQIPLVEKKEAPAIVANVNSISSASYPAHKTVAFNTTELTATETASVVKNNNANSLTPVVEKQQVEPVTVANQTPELSSVSDKITIQAGAYAAHKTHYFVADENVNVLAKEEVPKTQPLNNPQVQTAKTTANTATTTVKNTSAKKDEFDAVVASKAKSPAPWIIGIAAVLLTAAATYWITQSQQGSLKDEIAALKQRNDSLATSVKKLQKDIHFDDVIARGGKLDAKNNILVSGNATGSEVIRTCFSIAANPKALTGKKVVYFRFIDANNNVLSASKDAVFDFNGQQIAYSLKQEIVYKKDELMLCIDFKRTQKLDKGTYKAEIYNEGVLDATTTFELK